MDSTATILTLAVVAGAAGLGWYFWRGPSQPSLPALPPAPPPTGGVEPEEEEEAPAAPKPGEMPRPNLDDPKVAAADALVHRWFGERISGPRGMDKASRDAAIRELVEQQGATPGLAAVVLYDRQLKKRGQTPKRPPNEVREAMRVLGMKR